MKIMTVTMNPAIDKSSTVDHVIADRKLRCETPVFEPGGGGINVSRAIRKLEGQSLAFYPAGGESGELFRHLLDAEGLDHRSLQVEGRTRENFMIFEEATGRQFRFGMPGREMAESEWRSCLEEIFSTSPPPEFIVASGSLPPGVPDDFYARMARRCKENDIHLIVDTSGEALRLAVDEGVFLVKPNMNELTKLAGRELDHESDQEEFVRSLSGKGCCRYVVLSLGAAGVLTASEDGIQRLRAPTVIIKSKVGAGDSTVAGITMKLAEGVDFIDAVRYGIAAGAAAVMTPGSELCRKSDVEKLVKKIA